MIKLFTEAILTPLLCNPKSYQQSAGGVFAEDDARLFCRLQLSKTSGITAGLIKFTAASAAFMNVKAVTEGKNVCVCVCNLKTNSVFVLRLIRGVFLP